MGVEAWDTVKNQGAVTLKLVAGCWQIPGGGQVQGTADGVAKIPVRNVIDEFARIFESRGVQIALDQTCV